MYKSIRTLGAGAGMAALLAAGLNVATHAPDDLTSTSSSGGTAGDTITMSVDSTALETASFEPAEKAAVPCGFAATGAC
jgi:hypothetical protein